MKQYFKFSPFLENSVMHMIQAKELTQYKDDKSTAMLKQLLQTCSKQTYTVFDTPPHVLPAYKLKTS